MDRLDAGGSLSLTVYDKGRRINRRDRRPVISVDPKPKDKDPGYEVRVLYKRACIPFDVEFQGVCDSVYSLVTSGRDVRVVVKSVKDPELDKGVRGILTLNTEDVDDGSCGCFGRRKTGDIYRAQNGTHQENPGFGGVHLNGKGALSGRNPVTAWGPTARFGKRVTGLGDPALVDVKDVKDKGLDKGLKKALDKLVKLFAEPRKITGDVNHCCLDDLVSGHLDSEGTNICNVVVTYYKNSKYVHKRGTILHMAVNSLAYWTKNNLNKDVITAFIKRAGKQYGAVYGPVEQIGRRGRTYYQGVKYEPLDVLVGFCNDFDTRASMMSVKYEVYKVAHFFNEFYEVEPTSKQVGDAAHTLRNEDTHNFQLFLTRLTTGGELPWPS